MKEDKEFAIRMEPQGINPSGDEKYAIIGYFREKQRQQNRAVNHQAENVAPLSTQPNKCTIFKIVPPLILRRLPAAKHEGTSKELRTNFEPTSNNKKFTFFNHHGTYHFM